MFIYSGEEEDWLLAAGPRDRFREPIKKTCERFPGLSRVFKLCLDQYIYLLGMKASNLLWSSGEDGAYGAPDRPGQNNDEAAAKISGIQLADCSLSELPKTTFQDEQRVCTKKWKALRSHITQLINTAEEQLEERTERIKFSSTHAQIERIKARLKGANNTIELYLRTKLRTVN